MNRRILIVDDNATNLRLAANVLQIEGHDVDQVESAEQALEYLAGTVPDLVLMDIALPGMDGLTLTRRMKADARLRSVPVVALTAFAMKGDEEKALDAGCVGYLTKPIDTRRFGAQVARFLDPAQAQTLLIVDDNPTNLRLLRAQLETAGIEVIEAAHGEEALEKLATDKVDGIISDILMPRMDGYRLCLEVRKDERLCDLPFVLYTSTYDSPADRKLANAAGADAYVSKPAPLAELLSALANAGGQRRKPQLRDPELADPVLKQYSESLIRKLEEKSEQLGHAYEGLAQVEARLSGLVESALDAIIALDESQCIVLFNRAAEVMFGCSRDEALRQSIDMFIPRRFRDAHQVQVKRFGDGDRDAKRMGARMVWAQRADGTEFPVEASISRLGTSHGWLFTVFLRDISEQHRAQVALASSEQRLRKTNRVLSVLSGINNLIVRVRDRDELLTRSCRIAVEAGGFPIAWVGLFDGPGGWLHFAAGHGGDKHFLDELAQRLREQSDPRNADWFHVIRSLQPLILNDLTAEPGALSSALAGSSRSIAALPLVLDGTLTGVMVLHADETDFFDEQEMGLLTELAGDISFALDHLSKSDHLRFLANYDPLTGLPNRGAFTDRLAQALRPRANNHAPEMLAVVLLDLERFRRVNETLGRAAGDELLRQVASRLTDAEESVARLGVDVFALVFDQCRTPADVAHAFEELDQRCFQTPCVVSGSELRIGCRAGVAVHPGDGDSAEILLHNAEAALRRARQTSERYVFYAPELNARAAEALDLESRLRRAIKQREFVLHYQPKVDMATRRIKGVEALIRWRDPDHQGLVPPGSFIPVLEECGLIGEVGDWALEQAVQDQAAWAGQGLGTLRVAVNVSPLQLRRPDFADKLLGLTQAHKDAALELEITESVIMDDVDRNIDTLNTIRDAGIRVAVDDFGTGYCSLAYIAKLPITSLKIDRAFINGMTSGPEGLAIVSSIIALAHALRLKVVAEGVETEEQARLLGLLACDEAQGYLFRRPCPAEDLATLLKADAPLPRVAP